MSFLPKKFAVAAAGAAVLAAVAAAQPAAAATPQMVFYTGAFLTGSKTVADLDTSGQCQNLDPVAWSAHNPSSEKVEVFYKADCAPGLPGIPNDDRRVTMLAGYYESFRLPALSYRVVD
ncbi:hypothetical protein [Saccharothrix coeruleofusca]|uniref:Beta/gamma crystallin n=1 Tax=Saccharothrix coeruleofusca TaxID=33919 RepID=A0A918ARR6_9PSEU|nr:hypothetical protein [Saccharothrix coeruleofusca]MBP2335828.1 hypothetical protein [Saccharothrix coeruleofusca]GGP74938.1 hypothetical protein GCM10010185_55530 [Saccharothrix coeruleofusca]